MLCYVKMFCELRSRAMGVYVQLSLESLGTSGLGFRV